jgi:hypothetical protein
MANLPTFLIIGAAKAGTTTIFDLLKQHPQVFLPFAKEPMFFSHDDNYCKGLGWYANTFFKGSGSYPASGEATPHYLYWSEKTAIRIKNSYMDNQVKFIVVLRDPVARAFSWYGNMLKDGTETLSFEEALSFEDQRLESNKPELQRTGSMQFGYFQGGCYATLLRPFLELFQKDKFHFILQEDIIENHEKMTRDLLNFIGIEPNFLLKPVRSNSAAMPYSSELHSWLRNRSIMKDYLKKIIPFKLRYKLKIQLMNANLRPTKAPKMDRNTDKSLRKRYEHEILTLQAIINRDLSGWMFQ